MSIQNDIYFKWSTFSFIYLIMGFGVSCYPADKFNTELPEPELKAETRYPNGTVVGKYTYSDKDGNPIHVKYYADDASYGVELQSIKVLDTASSTSTTSNADDENWPPNFDTMKPIDPVLGTSELLNVKQKNNNKAKEKVNAYKAKTSDYETFYQNEIKSPRECAKDKVRVYLNKEKRIIRRALDNYQANKYCDRF